MKSLRGAAVAALLATGLVVSACGSSSNPLDTASDTPPSAGAGDTTPGSPSAPSGGASEGATGDQGGTDTGATGGAAGESTGAGESGTGSGSEAASGPIVIGSANFTESELIAEIYAAALTAKGVDVSTKLDIGSREVYLQAIKDGSINLLPEYTGGLLAAFDPDSSATAPDEVYQDLTAALPDSLEVLEMSKAQDQDSVTVTKETAEKYDLTSIGDLAPVAGDMTLGGSSEWKTRADGPQGLKKVYGVEFKDYKELDPGGPLSVKGLKTGLVQATDIFTTNPAIEENDFVVLKDPKNLFQAQNVVPLIAKSVATPTVKDTLNAVSAKLTTAALTEMQRVVQDTKADPADVAAKWVSDNGLS